MCKHQICSVCIIALVLLCIKTSAYAQELSYKQYSVRDGLPGSTVYHTLQDRNGFIWFATNQGVSRFDGRTFKNYSKEDGLPEDEIIKLYLDRYNNVWIISLLGIPAVFYNDSIIQFNHCPDVRAICEDQLNDSIVFVSTREENNNTVYGLYRSPDLPGHWKFTGRFKTDCSEWPVLRHSSGEKINFYFSTNNKKKSTLIIKSNTNTSRHFMGMDVDRAFSPQSFTAPTHDKRGIIFQANDTIYYADAKKILPVFTLSGLKIEEKLNFIFHENDSTVWLCTRNRGVLCIKNFLTPHKTVQEFFPQTFCTSILKDQENGYWITTHEDGVYYLPNLHFYTVPLHARAQNARCIQSINERSMAVGFANGDIFILNQKTAESELLLRSKNKRVLDIQLFGPNSLIIGGDGGIAILTNKKIVKKPVNATAVKGISVQPDSTIVIGANTGLLTIKIGRPGERKIFSSRVTCTRGIFNKYYWGTQHGVYAFFNDSVYSLAKVYPDLGGVINHLDIAPDSSLWVSSQKGIVILKDSTITLIGKEQGVLSNICKHVSFDGNTAWASTNKGISRIDYHWAGTHLYYYLSNITEEDGLIANDVNQTCVGGDYLWAATVNGLCFFSKEYISHSARNPLINITSIAAEEQFLPVADTIMMPSDKNKLRISLSGISYRSGRQIQYEYRLRDLDNHWSRLINNMVEFSTLPFGKIVFEVRAVDRWGRKSNSPKQLMIVHHPPFHKSVAFVWGTYFLLVALAGTGLYTFYKKQHRKKEQEYRLKRKMHDLEMKALQAQMNPHFIFNCLTSIQYHIMRADTLNANTFLHKFSTLIRQTLQYSTASTILLREEIKILTLYLELEKLRMGKRMDYIINVSDDLDPDDLMIPSMIIQPYVENAIKHGVSPLQDRVGMIIINIVRSENQIECFIEDNGPGIYSARQHGTISPATDHISMGINITESRINVINAIQQNKISLEVIDKKHSGMPRSGTIVHLSFPL